MFDCPHTASCLATWGAYCQHPLLHPAHHDQHDLLFCVQFGSSLSKQAVPTCTEEISHDLPHGEQSQAACSTLPHPVWS